MNKSLLDFIGHFLELKELPQLRFDVPNLTIGHKYKIIDVEGSNFWIIDDSGDRTSLYSGRFDLLNK